MKKYKQERMQLFGLKHSCSKLAIFNILNLHIRTLSLQVIAWSKINTPSWLISQNYKKK